MARRHINRELSGKGWKHSMALKPHKDGHIRNPLEEPAVVEQAPLSEDLDTALDVIEQEVEEPEPTLVSDDVEFVAPIEQTIIVPVFKPEKQAEKPKRRGRPRKSTVIDD